MAYIPPREIPLRRLRSLRRPHLSARVAEEQGQGRDFAKPYAPGAGLKGCSPRCPSILAAADFKAVVAAIRAARASGIAASSGALARTSSRPGLSPVLIDLMERGFVSALATNGAGIIHDFELALSGATSEDVDEALGPGRFGMAEETGRLLNAAINDGVADGLGSRPVGRATTCAPTPPPHARRQRRSPPPARLEIPVTVHVAHRHRHHPHASRRLGRGASARAACAISGIFVSNVAPPGRRRLSELRIRRRPAGSVPQGRRARAQPGALARRAHDGQPRFHAPCIARRPTSSSRPVAGIGKGYSLSAITRS